MSSKEAGNDTKGSSGQDLRRTTRHRSKVGDSEILSTARDSRRSKRQEVDASHEQGPRPSEEEAEGELQQELKQEQEEEGDLITASDQSIPVAGNCIEGETESSATVEVTTEEEAGGDKDKKMEPKKRRKRRPPLVPWKKPPDMPRRPLSAYNIFFREQRELLLSGGESAGSTLATEAEVAVTGGQKRRSSKSSKTVGIGFANLARTIASKWKSLDPESRAPYEAQANSEKDRYNEEMVVWRAKQKEEKDKAAASGAIGGMPLYDDDAENDDDGTSPKKRSPSMFPLSASRAPTSWIPPSETMEGGMSALSPAGSVARRNDASSFDMGFSPLSLKDTHAYSQEWFEAARRPVQQSTSPTPSHSSTGGGRGVGANITISMRGKDSIRRRTQKPNTGRNPDPEPNLQLFMDNMHESAKLPPMDMLETGMLPGTGSGLPWSNLARREDSAQFSDQQMALSPLQMGTPKTPTFSYPDAWFEVQTSDAGGGQVNPFSEEDMLKPAAMGGTPSEKLPARKPPPSLQGQESVFKGSETLFGGFHPQTGGALDAAFAAMNTAGIPNMSNLQRMEWSNRSGIQQQPQEMKISGANATQTTDSTSPTSMGIRSCEELASDYASVLSKAHSPELQQHAGTLTRRSRDSSSNFHWVERNSLRVLGNSLDEEAMDFITRLEFSSSSSSSSPE